MKRILAAIAVPVLLLTVFTALAGCGGSGTTSSSPDGQTDENVSTDNAVQQANNAVRQANLKMIDSAIQAYYVENGVYPTGINQLSQYFASGVPVDPLGGTYYIVTQGGVAKAAVR
jgi:predicted small lipoprotein YifL